MRATEKKLQLFNLRCNINKVLVWHLEAMMEFLVELLVFQVRWLHILRKPRRTFGSHWHHLTVVSLSEDSVNSGRPCSSIDRWIHMQLFLCQQGTWVNLLIKGITKTSRTLLVLQEETQIKVPISAVAMQKRGWSKWLWHYSREFPMGFPMVFPWGRALVFSKGVVWSFCFRREQVAGDEVCTPTDHISDWFSRLAIADPNRNFGFVKRNSDQSGARIDPERCSRYDGKKTRVRTNSRLVLLTLTQPIGLA
jgi:hypothetical protein